MSTQWEAANPTAANGVTDEIIRAAEKRALEAKAKPVTVADIEAEMRRAIDNGGRMENPSFGLYAAGTADQLRNYVAKIDEGRKKSGSRFEASAEGGGLAALMGGVSATVPNFSGPFLNAFKAGYMMALNRRVSSSKDARGC
jgi:hypothetical protein